MDYTIHNVTADLDAAVRARAQVESKSVNFILLDALRRGLGVEAKPPFEQDLSDLFDGTPLEPEVIQTLEDQRKAKRDLSDVAGKNLITDEMRAVFEEQRKIDPEIWK